MTACPGPGRGWAERMTGTGEAATCQDPGERLQPGEIVAEVRERRGERDIHWISPAAGTGLRWPRERLHLQGDEVV